MQKTFTMEKTLRFIGAYSLIVIVSALMAVIGDKLMGIYPNKLFGKYDLILPSVITWIILGREIQNKSMKQALKLSLFAPIVGSVLVCLLKIGPTNDWVYHGIASHFFGLILNLVYGLIFVCIYSPIVFPVSLFTAYVVKQIWQLVGCESHE